MSRRKIPIPEDFTAKARDISNLRLAELYDVSEGVIIRWRKLTGIPAPNIKPKGWKRGRPEVDTPEQIRMCLGCEFKNCNGNCVRMRIAKRSAVLCCT